MPSVPPSRRPTKLPPAIGPTVTLTWQEYTELLAALDDAVKAREKDRDAMIELNIQRLRLKAKAPPERKR